EKRPPSSRTPVDGEAGFLPGLAVEGRGGALVPPQQDRLSRKPGQQKPRPGVAPHPIEEPRAEPHEGLGGAVGSDLDEERSVHRLLLLAEPRGEVGTEILVRVDLARLGDELLLGLHVVGIGDAAVHRAYRGAGLLLVEAHAFRAEVRVDDEDILALGDRAVRALRLTGAAVDALLRDHRGHRNALLRWKRPPTGTPAGCGRSWRFLGRGPATLSGLR